MYGTPPPQSRDATVSSRFFPSTSASYGTVLVPSSSPMNSAVDNRSQHPFSQTHDYDVAPIPGLIHSNLWSQSSRPLGVDPLTTSSGFMTNGGGPHASFRHPWVGDDGHSEGMGVEGPLRKRINRGHSQDPLDMLNSPGSPDVQRHGKRRRLAPNNNDALSTSSDESIPEARHILAGPSKPRITRGRRPGSQDPPSIDPSQSESEDPKFTRFKVTMPLHSIALVKSAWQHANGDVKRATALLSDPTWDPKPAVAPRPVLEATGRVKEIEEATRAQKAAIKEKGKKSMIYAMRSVLDNKPSRMSTPPASKASAIDLTASSPLSPVPAPTRRIRPKKLVVDSEPEIELTDSEEERNRGTNRGRQGISDDTRALEYFNTTGPEALQELTGTFTHLSLIVYLTEWPVGCTPEQANTIIELRPFLDVDDLNSKLGQGKKKSGPAGISPRMFEDCTAIFKGYGTVDTILEDCERIGSTLRTAIAAWTSAGQAGKGKTREGGPSLGSSPAPVLDETDDGALSLRSLTPLKQKPKDYLVTQPALLSDNVQLKEYQLLGVNWLNLLYRSNLSCILADEMGMSVWIMINSCRLWGMFIRSWQNNTSD